MFRNICSNIINLAKGLKYINMQMCENDSNYAIE